LLCLLSCLACERGVESRAQHAEPRETSTTLHFEEPAPGLDSLRLQVNHRPGTFLFDSGLGLSILTPEMAKLTGCAPWGKLVGFRATGERLSLQRCNHPVIDGADVSLEPPLMGVFAIGSFVGPIGKDISGAIGLDVFDGKVVTLSVANRTLTIESAQHAREIAAAEQEVPIRLVRDVDGTALGADLGVKTPKGMIWLEIDTGNSGPSLIDPSIAPMLGLRADEKGEQPLHIADDGVHFGGPCLVRDLIRDGNLGRAALQPWEITLDLKNSRGWVRASHAIVREGTAPGARP
jgi:hypothetical protein